MALIWKPSMSLGRAPAPVPRKKGNQGSSRWIGRRRRGRSLRPPVRGRPALRHPPLFQGGFEDRPSTAIATGFLSREISIAAKHTDREFRVARVLRGICDADHHFDALRFSALNAALTALETNRDRGIPSTADLVLKYSMSSVGRLTLVFINAHCMVILVLLVIPR